MTEDDTYEALLRIPRRELENGTADLICSTIRYNERLRREDIKINDKEYKKWKRWNRFSFLGIYYPLSLSSTRIDDTVLESKANLVFGGSGWTYKSYCAEVNKDLDKEDKKIQQIKRKYLYFLAISIVLLLPFIWYIISLVPWLLLKPVVGVMLGLVLGHGLVQISKMFIS